MLDICYNDILWAQLYYERCTVPNTMLYIMDHPGPLRVRLKSGAVQYVLILFLMLIIGFFFV